MGHACQTLAIFTIVLAGTAAARGAEQDFRVDGRALAIVSPCAAQVTIDPDPSLDGSIRVAATASHPEEIARLSIATEAGRARIGLADPDHRCWRQAGATAWSPTLGLRIRVPSHLSVSIDEDGAANYAIGPIDGPLSADLSGAVTLSAAQPTSLTLDLSGAVRIAIGTVAGPAVVRSAGQATVRIEHATAPTLLVAMSGSGRADVAGGTIGSLAVKDSGAAEVAIGGTTGNATLSLSGAGGVRIARLTGSLRKEVSGRATVEIGR